MNGNKLTLIDVTPSDFLRIPRNRGIIRMLQAIRLAGPDGLATNEAAIQVFNSRQYGNRILKQALEQGYIVRERMPRSEGGHYYIINKLTPAGDKLLQELSMNNNA